MVYWSLSAPDPRFAYDVILAATSLVLARSCQKIHFSNLFIDTLFLFILIFSSWLTYISIPWKNFSKYIISPPPIQEYQVTEHTLEDGSSIFIPKEGIQCWDAPLSCTGWIYDGLIMRGTDLSEGYKITK